ncbi:porin family protein [Roseibacterium beibuensis]|uniref:outer membrane protein n=1 Tax=[Roseibacterium] beibuensis TaxID=1193142 RepID=UPI00217E43AE|nr:porin family protein [Roseibacterium beibuensis]MCS6626428.1 porin family protein [Roseibacterium beibuensis]
MKTTLVLAAIAAGAMATPALAQDASSNYVQINLGASVAGDVDLDVTVGPDTFSGEADFETGAFGSITAGFGLEGGFAVEGELLLLTSDIDTDAADAALGAPLDANVESYAAMVNAVYNFQAGGMSPYVGAGVGFGNAKYRLGGESEDDMGIAWQVKAGVVIPSSETLSWDIGYRFVSLPGFELSEPGASVEADGSAHVVSVGARIAF